MKKYIKPATLLTAGINVDSFMTTATTDTGGHIPDGGGASGSGITTGTGKRRDRFAVEDEEFDPILQLLIDKEEGNNNDLW